MTEIAFKLEATTQTHIPGMKELTNKRKCTFPQCRQWACYDVVDEAYQQGHIPKERKWIQPVCTKHRQSVHVRFLNGNPVCTQCGKFAAYGFSGQSVQSCADHRQPGMILWCRRRCQDKGCSRFAHYGVQQCPYWCSHHAPAHAVDLTKTTPSRYRYYQELVKSWIQECADQHLFPHPTSHDRSIQSLLCLPPMRSYRPDFVWIFDLSQRIVLLEVDENGHRDRCMYYESKRMEDINKTLPFAQIHWIRYSPSLEPSKERERFLNILQQALL